MIWSMTMFGAEQWIRQFKSDHCVLSRQDSAVSEFSVLTSELCMQWRLLWSEDSGMSNEDANKEKGDASKLRLLSLATPTWLYLSPLILCY
jgi:hypothetical protein